MRRVRLTEKKEKTKEKTTSMYRKRTGGFETTVKIN